MDFSENLSVSVKYEPQSLHWALDQVIVHSGILKGHGHKSYHPYFSDSKIHDQVFVNEVLLEMLQNVGVLAKVIIHKGVAAVDVFLSSSTMVYYLDAKFKYSTNPEYIVKEIDSSLSEENRAAANLLVHPTIDVSSTF